MQKSDKYKFIEAMVVEVAPHEGRDDWTMVPR